MKEENTYRRFNEGDHKYTDFSEAIFEQDHSHKCPTYVHTTPPCQGMSTVGKQDKLDERNQLIYYALEVIKSVKPKYVLIENVPQQLKTSILVNNVFFINSRIYKTIFKK